jgi:hypothetical protein
MKNLIVGIILGTIASLLIRDALANGQIWSYKRDNNGFIQADGVQVSKYLDGSSINCYIATATQQGGQGYQGTNVAISCLKVK